ncbi:hypothetical protein AYJ08_17065 [Brevibacillus sp. SKDU10]|uniref:DUF2508 family protein n=1 Tax=Brevibacillus sp. SKDU10 TaxID=1247872 RepID=UPI0007C8FD07|nr:DUF2508 family protein [Brevibacillus sp. SKDU10]OAJ72820.1 hypothetical protein AYJ08_17065 [Brevibacillus sp. SKDU10]
MKWLKRNAGLKEQQVQPYHLQEAIANALQYWQNAQRHVDVSEGFQQIDHFIYQYRLAEKRYMYLLKQIRRRNEKQRDA